MVLEFLTGRNPNDRFSLVIGTDILPERTKWKDFPRIEQLAGIVVVPRSGYGDPATPGPARPEVASPEVRGRLVRGEDVTHLVPRTVAEYAIRNGLYRSAEI